MLLNKLGEFIPIGYLVRCPMRTIRLWLDITRFSLALQPQVNRIATDLKDLSRFGFLHPV